MNDLRRPLAVTLLSASTLAYEILLVRIFAIEHFHHFAYMAIGVAMLGFGASGTLLAIIPRHRLKGAPSWFVWAAVLTPASLIASATLVHLIPLDATQLPWDPWQWVRLASVYLLLALPFAVGALAVLLALTLESERSGLIYGASFLGAGGGAALALVILWVLLPARAQAGPAVGASRAAVAAANGARKAAVPIVEATVSVVLAAGTIMRPLWSLDINPFKGLPQVEAFPDARRVAERASPVGWVVAVQAPAFRHAPGLSLAYRGQFPRQTALFVDGDISGAISDWGRDDEAMQLLDWLPSALPYARGKNEHVLIVGAGGGNEIWNALLHGARMIKAVELHPEIVNLTATLALDPTSWAGNAEVDWAVGDARSYIARSRDDFDLISLGAGGAFGTSAAAVYSLNEDFLHTEEAYASYLERLNDGGVLAITRWLTVPPRESVRVILTAAEALRRRAPGTVGEGLVVARSWATATILVKPGGFTGAEINSLNVWAHSRRFDLDWYPGIEAPKAEFNFMDQPALFWAAEAATAGPDSAASFAAAYPFDVAPAGDARPYPHHFLRASSVGALLGSGRASLLPFAEWGYVSLLANLAQSLVLAGLLMLVPAALIARAEAGGDRLRLIGYFTAIGLAYLAAEIAAIQQLNLLLGHPVYAVAAVLAAFLVFSGFGSAWSDRVAADRGWMASAGLALMLVLYALVTLALVHVLQPAHLVLRAGAAVLLLAPLAFLMGIPFPTGLRALAGDETGRMAWAWAANGFASVVAAPLAALIALEAGSRLLFVVAAVAYAGASMSVRGSARAQILNQ